MDDKSEQDDCSYDTEAVQDSSENASQQLVIGNCTFPSEIYTNTETNDDRFGEVDLSALMIKGDETQQHPNSWQGHGFRHEDLLQLVLSEKVPAILGLVAITGLPHSNKSQVLKNVMVKNIRLKRGSDVLLRYLEGRHDPKGLSAYELPILGNGPNYHAWFLAFKRCSATFCTLSALLQKQGFNRQAIDFVGNENGDTVLLSPLLDGQLKWLHKEMAENYKRIISDEHEQKVDLLRSGVCLINVFDLGIDRALQEFFNIISRYCPNLVQLAFFDLARDAKEFLYPFKPSSSSQRIGGELIKWRPRLHHLIQSPNPRKNLFVATYHIDESLALMPEAQQLIKDEVEHTQKQNVAENAPAMSQQPQLYAVKVDGGDEEYAAFREKIDEKIFNLPKIDLPLKWIFLRSCLAVHHKNSMYVPLKVIQVLGYELCMSPEDVKAFLTHFTSCGSLLYIPELPPLDENVIINIQRFSKCLETLFHSKTRHHAKSLEESGIFSLKAAEKKISGAAEFVLKTLVGIGMAAEIHGGRLQTKSPLVSREESSDHYYYLPSARAVELKKEKKSSSAYIITSKRDLPVDSQARFTSAILEAIPEFQLAPSKKYNRTLFEYHKNGDAGNAPRLTITFHGDMTELRVNMKNVDQDKFPSPVRMCAKVLEVCLRHLSKQEIQFNVGLQCLRDPAADYHFLFSGRKDDEGDKEKSVKSSGEYHDKAEDCHEECLTETKESNPKRVSWIQAGAECQKIAEEDVDNLIVRQARLVFPVLCQLARILKEANLKHSQQEQLIHELGFVDQDKRELEAYSKSRFYMVMLLKWEKKFGSVGTTKKLAKAFRECKLWKAANLIAYEYSPPPSPAEPMLTVEN